MLNIIPFYQIFSSWLIFFAILFTTIKIFKDYNKDKMTLSFAWFWLMAAGVWFSAGFVGLFWRMGFDSFSRIAVYLSYFFIILEGPFLIYYLVMKTLNRNRLAKFFFLIYFLGSLIFLFWLFKEGLQGPRFYELGIRFYPGVYTFLTLQVLYIGPTFFVFYDLFKRLFLWTINATLGDKILFFTTISIIVYMTGGYFDAKGTLDLWQILFFRTVILAGVLTSYLVYSAQSLKSNLFEV